MMPEPDFDQIARRIRSLFGIVQDSTHAIADAEQAAVVAQLRQVWNARGVSDIERWILMNVDERVVPEDEGHGDALKYNLIHLLRDGPGYRRFEYAADQEAEIASWVKPE